MNNSGQEWLWEFIKLGAIWEHDDDFYKPHALLTHGSHSSGMFDGSEIIKDPALLNPVCSDLLEKAGFKNSNIGNLPFYSVFGIAGGSSDMSLDMGGQLGITRGFVEKDIGGNNEKKMMLKRFSVGKKETVLLVDDAFTTGGSLELAIDALESAGAVVFDTILVIMNRSENGVQTLGKRRIVSLVEYPMPLWANKKECPLCHKGSEAVRLKGQLV